MSLSDVPLVGCRINIISKAKIRYEGYLHSVDCDTPGEPVITLSKVWSFGTEDRTCDRPVAPRNEEYNQVVFRGRDLEDVWVAQSSVFMNEDSAIVSAAPGTSITPLSNAQPSDRKSDGPSFEQKPHTSLGGSDILQNLSPQSVSISGMNAAPGSRNNTQNVGSRPGPIGTMQSEITSTVPAMRGPRPFGDGRSDGDMTTLASGIKLDVFGRSPADANKQRTVLGSSPRFDSSQPWDTRGSFQCSSGFTRDGAPVCNFTGNGSDRFQPRRDGYGNQGAPRGGMRQGQSGYYRRGSRGLGSHGWTRPHSGITSIGGVDNTSYKYDYDYEKANAELAAVLDKIHITPSKPPSTDGDTTKDESGSSVTGDENYDKTKSFYDTLSSEMITKASGAQPKGMTRREERMLNSATFGPLPSNHYSRRGGSGYRYPRGGGGYGGNYGYRRPGGNSYWSFANNHGSRSQYNPPAPTPLSSTNNAD